MSNEMTRETLERVVVDLLQDAAFVFAEPIETTDRNEESVLVAKLGFNGPTAGELLLSCSPNVATDFAANLLGVEPDDPDAVERGSDALGEMLNIVCGALLADWFGVDGEFEMGVPSVTQVAPGNYAEQTATASVLLPLETDDGDRIDVALLP